MYNNNISTVHILYFPRFFYDRKKIYFEYEYIDVCGDKTHRMWKRVRYQNAYVSEKIYNTNQKKHDFYKILPSIKF